MHCKFGTLLQSNSSFDLVPSRRRWSIVGFELISADVSGLLAGNRQILKLNESQSAFDSDDQPDERPAPRCTGGCGPLEAIPGLQMRTKLRHASRPLGGQPLCFGVFFLFGPLPLPSENGLAL